MIKSLIHFYHMPPVVSATWQDLIFVKLMNGFCEAEIQARNNGTMPNITFVFKASGFSAMISSPSVFGTYCLLFIKQKPFILLKKGWRRLFFPFMLSLNLEIWMVCDLRTWDSQKGICENVLLLIFHLFSYYSEA